MNKTRLFFGLAAVAGLSLGMVRNASAASIWMQGASGHLYNGTGFGALTMSDGKMCSPMSSVGGNYWIIPIPITSTNRSYSGTQYGQGVAGALPATRFISFNPNGSVYQIGTQSQSAAIAAVTVPTNGTLFSQHYVYTVSCSPLCLQECLATVQVTY